MAGVTIRKPKFGIVAWSVCQAGLAVGLAAGPPEPCWRGREGSTFQAWTFSTRTNPATPEVSSNAYGLATASVTLGFMASGWLRDAGLGSRTGYWDLGGSGLITVAIPNQAADGPQASKYVCVEVTHWDHPPLFVAPSVAVAGGSLIQQTNWVVEPTGFGGWSAYRGLWRLESASESESIVITAGTNGGIVDQVVVDTCLVPAPSVANLVLAADPGLCSRSNVSYVGLPLVDGCVVTNVSCSPPSGATLPVGITPVNCQVTDAWGGVRPVSFTVIVDDVPAEQWRLSIRRLGPAGETLELGWPASCVPAVLEESLDVVSGTNWRPAGLPVECHDGQCCARIEPGQGTRFFRLRRF